MIDSAFFDFSGTLVNGRLDILSCRKSAFELLRSNGFDVTLSQYNSALEMALAWRKDQSRSGNIEISSKLLEKHALESLCITASEHLLGQIDDLEYEHYHWTLLPGAREMLETISHEYRLGIISNSRSCSPIRVLKEESLLDLFESIILSKDIGFRKPDSRIFNYALSKMKTRANNAVFVGDSFAKDVKGASQTGMHTIWLANGEGCVPRGCDAMARYLKEVPQLIKQLSSFRTHYDWKVIPQLHVVQHNL